MSFKHLVIFGTIGLLALAGCSTPKTTASRPTDTTTTSTTVSQSSATTRSSSPETAQSSVPQTKYSALSTVVSNTKTAVEVGDFNQAKQSFEQFEGAWSQVEDDIKATSRENYNAIEEGMDQVTAALRSSDKEKALAALQSLDATINQIPQ